MKRFILFLVFLVASGASQAFKSLDLSDSKFSGTKTWDYVVSDSGDIYVAHHSRDGNIYLNKNGISIDLDKDGPKSSSAGMAITGDGNNIHVVWREKTTIKRLMYTRSMDSGQSFTDPVNLDTDSEPLARLKIDSRGDWVFVSWLGEKSYPDDGFGKKGKPDYNIYFKYSKDQGKTFSDTIKVVGGIYPVWAVNDNEAYIVSWFPLEDGGDTHTLVRRFDFATESWDPIQPIAPIPKLTPVFKAIQSGDRLIVVWMSLSHTTGSNFQLEGAYSDDKGKFWTGFDFPALQGYDFAKLEVAADTEGKVYLVGSARKRKGKDKKQDQLFLLKSTDQGTTWDSPALLRIDPFPKQTMARYPSISVSDSGMVAVGWEDWRNVGPSYFINVSRDAGKTWMKQDLSVGEDGANLYADGLVNVLSWSGDKLNLVTPKFPTDHLRHPVLVGYQLSNGELRVVEPTDASPAWLEQIQQAWDELLGYFDSDKAMESGSDRTKPDLKKRVHRYWNAMIDKEMRDAYAVHDPFYRARFDEISYLAKRGSIRYHSHEVKGIEIQGNIAKVALVIEYSIAAVMTNMGEFKRDKRNTRITDTWVYVHGEWYKEYFDEASNHTYTKYSRKK